MKVFRKFNEDFLSHISFVRPLGFPSIRITSIYRPGETGTHGKEDNAFDFVFIFKDSKNAENKTLAMVKYLNVFWSGGFGYNQTQICRHFHLDSSTKRRWIEKTKKEIYRKTNSCQKSLLVLPWKNPGNINENDKNFYKNEFSLSNTIQFPDGTIKTYNELKEESNKPLKIGDQSAFSYLAFLPLIFLFLKRGKNENKHRKSFY